MPMLRVRTAPHDGRDLVRDDATGVGCGAGGIAEHALGSRGLEVLLEIGRKPDLDRELKSMPWPYDHPRERDA